MYRVRNKKTKTGNEGAGFMKKERRIDKIYSLTPMQEGMLFHSLKDTESLFYFEQYMFTLKGTIDKTLLQESFNRVIKRHDILRTLFVHDKIQKPRQVVIEDLALDIYFEEISHLKEGEQKTFLEEFKKKDRARGFDLTRELLMRVYLFKTGTHLYKLLWSSHHITMDGWSSGIFIKELLQVYCSLKKGESTRFAPAIPFRNYVKWLEKQDKDEGLKYWRHYLEGYEQPASVPKFRKPTGDGKYKMKEYHFMFDEELSAGLNKIASENQVTINMVFQVLWGLLLQKYNNTDDAVFGTVVSGRPSEIEGIENMIGLFINSIPVRIKSPGEQEFSQILIQLHKKTISSRLYEYLPLAEVQGCSSLNRKLIDHLMTFENYPVEEQFRNAGKGLDIGFEIENIELFEQTNYDFNILAFPGKCFSFMFRFNLSVYRLDFINKLVLHLNQLAKQVVKNPGIKVREICILSEEEEKRQLIDFNETKSVFPEDKTIHELFEDQAARKPDNIALTWHDAQLTYHHLEKKANQLANYLHTGKNIQPNNLVGILMDNSIDIIIAILGIQKAGGAYVPIDPSLPGDRIKMIINDAKIEVIISGKKYTGILNHLQWECDHFHTFLCMDSEDVYSEDEVEKNQLMDKKLWEYVGETATDEITGGGWLTGYTGEPFTREEMDEYGDNILNKLAPLLYKKMRVLEIGCASGITMYRLAPKVGFYYGTDLSSVIIEKNKKRVREEGHQNIKLACLPAHEIEKQGEENFDLIILNRVVQSFYGHNYLRKVIRKLMGLLGEKGFLFIGGIMDQELKEALIRDMKTFKLTNQDKNYKTKTDWSTELFLPRPFFEDLGIEYPEIVKVEFSRKIHTRGSELTKFHYDTLITIDKKEKKSEIRRAKHKYQEDINTLRKYSTGKPASAVSPTHLAYIIYTSGTTGKPKGVAVQHRSLVDYVWWGIKQYIGKEPVVFSLYTSPSFDLTVTSIYLPLISGNSMVIYENDRTQLPIQKIIRENKVDIIKATPSHLKLLLHTDTVCQENTRVKKFIVGGEELETGLVHDLYNRFSRDIEIYNEYGPTEATVGCMIYRFDPKKDNRGSVSIGIPVDNAAIYILDKYLKPTPVNAVGEIYISGIPLSPGYLNQLCLTNEKFIENPYVTKEPPGKTANKMYRTGDLAQRLPDGNIEFLGRVDEQVKIRGYRIELKEIEKALKNNDEITDAVVIARETGGGGSNKKKDDDNVLYAYVKADRTVEISELRNFLLKELPEYMIPSYFIQLDKIPVTINGKIDKNALPGFKVSVGEDYTPPADEIETKLVEIWSEVLGLKKEVISIDSNFFDIGGHSLKATTLVSRIHKALNVKIPLNKIFKFPTIREIAKYIKGTEKEKYFGIDPVAKKEYYELSSAQKRLYILQQLDPESTAYIIPTMVSLGEDVELQRLQITLLKIIARHESLRTSFHMVDNQPVQKVHDAAEIAPNWSLTMRERDDGNIARPFDLSRAPLLQTQLTKTGEGKYTLFFALHHIISDGISQFLLEKEFLALYAGKELPPLPLQYKDYAQWQNSSQQQEKIKQQGSYWTHLFSGQVPVLNLPTDYERPLMQSFEGASVSFVLNQKETRALKDTARENQVTLYMIILAMFNVFLSKLSGQEDIIVGTPIAGRRHADLKNIVGMFLNTLAIRNYPNGDKSFKQLLGQVKQRTLEAYENQEYPFEDLVDNISILRDTSRNPIFDVMFNMMNEEDNTADDPPPVTDAGHRPGPVKFDLVLRAGEYGNILLFNLEYCSKLFKKETIDRIVGYFKTVINATLSNPDIKLSHIGILPRAEKEAKITRFNEDLRQTLESRTLQDRLFRSFQKHGDRVAIEYGTYRLLYSQLENKSTVIANRLISADIPKGSSVGIYLEDRVEIITVMIGILKAGCVFVPFETLLPPGRIETMIRLTQPRVIFTDAAYQNKLPTEGGALRDNLQIVIIDDSFYSGEEALLMPENKVQYDPEDKIYVYFTSGSTGIPNAVVGRNEGLLHFVDWEIDTFRIYHSFRFSQFTNPGFDVFLRDTFVPLCAGGTICIPENRDSVLNSDKIGDWIEEKNISFIHMVPSVFKLLVSGDLNNHGFQHLKYILLAGEKITPSTLGKWYHIVGESVQLVNIYGPTETTLAKMFHLITQRDVLEEIIPIGRPIRGSRVIILDRDMNPCGTGITGELYIRTPYRSHGYYNNPGLNRERFLPNPFSRDAADLVYKTGDLGRELEDGCIEFIDRIDRQVKIRGMRIELGEPESALFEHRDIQDAVVLPKKDGAGETFLCAYIVSGRSLNVSELREYLLKKLPGYMVPAFFLFLDKMPLTSNGKLDRDALPQPEVKINARYIAPRNAVEEKLADIWANLLGIEKEKIGIDDGFFQLGGHSLRANIMAARVHKELNVELPLADIFKTPTIRALSKRIEKLSAVKYAAIKPIAEQEFYSLSSAQNRLYILQQMNEKSTRFHISSIFRLEGLLEKDRVENAFKRLIQRHGSFRTSFEVQGNYPIQRIHETVDFKMEYYESGSGEDRAKPDKELEAKRIVRQFLRYFDLSRAPLLRVGMIRTAQESHILMVDMHHIISDGTSLQVAVREFMAFYAGEELPPLRVQYKDFSAWQKNLIASGAIKKQEEYWLNRFKGDIPVLSMPLDYSRPPVINAYGDCIYFDLDKDLTFALKKMALDMEMTLYILLLGAYTILLSKYSGQEDIVVGTPVAGRRHADLGNIIGLFANMMAMRNQPEGEMTVPQFLEDVKKNALEAYENQEYPFEQLVWNLNIKAEGSRHPLFDAVFVLQNTAADRVRINSKNQETLNKIKIFPYDYEVENIHHELLLTVEEGSDTLSMNLQYAVELYKESTARNLSKHYIEILEQIASDRNIPLKDIRISHDFITASPDVARDEIGDFRL